MRLTQLLKKINKKRISVSISPHEFLDVQSLNAINPAFCLVQWSGINSNYIFTDNTDDSHFMCASLAKCRELINLGYIVVMWVNCRSMTREHAMEVLNKARYYGVKNVLVSHTNYPEKADKHKDRDKELEVVREKPEKDHDFPISADFIQFLRSEFSGIFEIIIFGYPHRESDDVTSTFKLSMDTLKAKVHAGAEVILVHASVTYKNYKAFQERCQKINLKLPMIASVILLNTPLDFKIMQDIGKGMPSKRIFEFVEQNKNNSRAIRYYGKKITDSILQCLLYEDLFYGPIVMGSTKLDYVLQYLRECGVIK